MNRPSEAEMKENLVPSIRFRVIHNQFKTKCRGIIYIHPKDRMQISLEGEFFLSSTHKYLWLGILQVKVYAFNIVASNLIKVCHWPEKTGKTKMSKVIRFYMLTTKSFCLCIEWSINYIKYHLACMSKRVIQKKRGFITAAKSTVAQKWFLFVLGILQHFFSFFCNLKLSYLLQKLSGIYSLQKWGFHI